MLWLAIAVVTVLATAWVTRPLWAPSDAAVAAAVDPAAQIYKDQLSEIDADLARGLIGAAEAEAARVEVARRLLAHDASRSATAASAPVAAGFGWAGAALVAAIPASAIAVYVAIGTPWLPDQPFASRQDGAPAQVRLMQAFERLEEHLADNPDDGEGWDRIAPAYLRLGRYEQAVTAYERAIALNGETLGRLTGLARAHIFHDDGRVNGAALKALEAAVRLQPGNLDNRFWMAVGREQAGSVVEAIDEFKRLLAEGQPAAPWYKLAQQRLAAAEARLANSGPRTTAIANAAEPGSAPGMPQLSQDQIDAARQMSGGDQKAMIEGMVGRLADRLKSNGKDPEGWQRLVRAYVVLGRRKDAVAALGEARRQLASDLEALARLDGLAKELGIGS